MAIDVLGYPKLFTEGAVQFELRPNLQKIVVYPSLDFQLKTGSRYLSGKVNFLYFLCSHLYFLSVDYSFGL